MAIKRKCEQYFFIPLSRAAYKSWILTEYELNLLEFCLSLININQYFVSEEISRPLSVILSIAEVWNFMYVTVFQMTSHHFNYSDVNDQRVIFLSHVII